VGAGGKRRRWREANEDVTFIHDEPGISFTGFPLLRE
jgi:hypothetical protein